MLVTKYVLVRGEVNGLVRMRESEHWRSQSTSSEHLMKYNLTHIPHPKVVFGV
jgi:hypothetical protein